MGWCKLSIWVLIILYCTCTSTVCGKENIKRIAELKAVSSRAECNIKQLLHSPNKNDIIKCSSFGLVDTYLVPNRTLCQVTRNETVFQYHCDEGIWKPSKGTDFLIRQKRFGFLAALGIAAAVAGIVSASIAVVKLIYCSKKYGNIVCKEETVSQDELEAPKYIVCPPADILPLYIADRNQKTVQVMWSDPNATDDKELISNEQTGGFKKGDPFPGLPNEGLVHNIIYTAKDSHGLTETCSFSFHVKYLTCVEPTTPRNGWKVSCPDGYIYGGECTFECFNGYEMVGSNIATCQQDETWDISPTCKKITCHPPFTTTNGNVTCDDTKYEYDDDCLISCNNGFKLNGPSKMTCMADKTWSVESSDVSCIDDDPPIISCHSPQIFYADRGSFNASVSWTVPTATDNVDANPSIVKISGPEIGDTLSEGFHSVKYEVTDSAGNSFQALSECTVVLEVKVIKCSTGPTDALDDSRFMMFNCSDTSFYNGVLCELYCDLNLPLNGTNIITCERDGITDKGKWSWGDEHQPFCEVVECPAIDPPKYGSLTTDSINARPLHVMSCQKGYDIPSIGSQFQGRLSCQDSGNWYPLEAFPECIKSDLPWLNLPLELYYEGDCNDNETKIQIKEQMLVYLSGVKADIDNSICPNNNTCKIENLDVVCGDTSGRKRKSAFSHKIFKRNAYGLIKFDILKIWDQGNKSTQNAYFDISNDLNSIADKIEQDAKNKVVLNIDGLTLPSDGVQRGSPDFFCEPGYKVDKGSLSCKPCPSGFYLDSNTGSCEFCKIGEYMDHSGASQCSKCQDGFSTLSSGSKDISECLKLCSPGYYSSNTMEPCSACPIGTYQSEKGQSTCLSCQPGKATSKTSCMSENDCGFFDVFINGLNQRTIIGTFLTNKSSVLTMSVWLKLHDDMTEDVVIYIADSNDDIVTLRLTNDISIQAGAGYVVLTDSRLSTSNWTHILCEIDIASGTLLLYVSGSLEVEGAGILIETSRTLSEGSIAIVADSHGLYVSGMAIYGRALSNDDKRSLSQTCGPISSDEVFTMTGILPYIEDGISLITPTLCDPIDECANKNPCGTNSCVNMVNGFSCICNGGMTGDLCDIPPNYCIDNKCVYGECQSGNGTYSCVCNNGYSGVFCNIPPVNGGWSEWNEWSGCSVTCGGGLSSRSRTCNNPTPSPFGNDCEGGSTEAVSCSDKACLTCPQLVRKFGTIVNCQNVSANLQKCNMTCLPGRALPSGQTNFVEYTCGDSTGQKWLPIDKLPECVHLTRPDYFGTQASVEYKHPIFESVQTDVTAAVENNLNHIGCVQHDACTLTTTVLNGNKSRKRRTTSATLTVHFSIKLNETGDYNLEGYLSNGTETSAMTELLGALNSMNEAIEFMQNNTDTIFQVTVDGFDYTLENSTIDFAATVTCPSGYAGADGLCALCQAGTYLFDFQCINCDVGTYQPLTGQRECLFCPSGYTTASYGATDISDCSVEEADESDSHDEDGDDGHDQEHVNKDNKKTVTIVVSALVVVVCVPAIIIGGFCLWKQINRRLFRNDKTTGSFASLSMVRSSSSLSNVEDNYRTKFNANEALPATSEIPLENCMKDKPPSYESHDFN